MAGSRGLRDGSSGYDSSDNETTNQYKQNRKYRSDPDFRMQNVHPSYHQHHHNSVHHPGNGIPLAAMHQGGIKPSPSQWNRNKSISEANLLAAEYGRSYHSGQFRDLRDPRRNSIADFGHGHDAIDHSVMGHINRPMSKAESHLSMTASRRGPSIIRTDYISHHDEEPPTFMYPHLQVNNIGIWPESGTCCLKSKNHLLLNEISFEVRGGEIMAVMATSEQEGAVLLDTIAGLRSPLIGEILLNGQHVKAHSLRSRVAYVQEDAHLCEEMTVVQTLRFHHDLKKPTDKLGYLKIDAMDRINVLIEDLGLEQVRNTKVSQMTISEKRRLNVACHLLLDTDIVVLDQPTKGMDIFDSFFLVEYLRQWANGGAGNSLGRIVILTLHPPTYEIFTMLSRILLMSAGRTMYSGKRHNMLPYFALVDYPCPSFKNPSDYYLDLVTLDDLSAEAMLESSQRIEQLAEIFRQKQEPMSDPGPPSALPMTIKNSNFLVQAFVLFTKAMFYTQPNTFISWLTLIVVSASLSFIIGAIFWDIPNTDAQLTLNDRLGYHYAVMGLMAWPLLLLLTLTEVRRNRRTVERDIKDGLYGRTTYIITKTIINLFPSLFIWLIYLVPSYSMSSLYMQSLKNYDGFHIYTGVMLIYFSCIQMLILAFIYLFPTISNMAVIIASFILSAFLFSSGYVIHFKDLPIYFKWLRYVSPTTWLLPYLANRELSPEAIASTSSSLLCRNKQVQHQDIIVQLPCPPPNGTQVLVNYGYLAEPNGFYSNYYGNSTPVAMVIFYLVCFVVGIIAFICFYRSKPKRSDNNKL